MNWLPMVQGGLYARSRAGHYFELRPVPNGIDVLVRVPPPEVPGWHTTMITSLRYDRTCGNLDEAKQACEQFEKEWGACDTG